MSLSVEERLVAAARERIGKHLNKLYEELGHPSRIKEDPAVTGFECAKYIWQINGLKEALRHLKDADDELNGRARKKD